MSKSEDVKEKMELLQILVTREDVDQIVLNQHERFSKSELTRQGSGRMAMAFFQGAKALLSGLSKEKAKEAMAKASYDFAYMGG